MISSHSPFRNLGRDFKSLKIRLKSLSKSIDEVEPSKPEDRTQQVQKPVISKPKEPKPVISKPKEPKPVKQPLFEPFEIDKPVLPKQDEKVTAEIKQPVLPTQNKVEPKPVQHKPVEQKESIVEQPMPKKNDYRIRRVDNNYFELYDRKGEYLNSFRTQQAAQEVLNSVSNIDNVLKSGDKNAAENRVLDTLNKAGKLMPFGAIRSALGLSYEDNPYFGTQIEALERLGVLVKNRPLHSADTEYGLTPKGSAIANQVKLRDIVKYDNEGKGLLEAVIEGENDAVGPFKDWLLENGHPEEAELLEDKDPNREAKEKKQLIESLSIPIEKLSKGVSLDYRKIVSDIGRNAADIVYAKYTETWDKTRSDESAIRAANNEYIKLAAKKKEFDTAASKLYNDVLERTGDAERASLESDRYREKMK